MKVEANTPFTVRHTFTDANGVAIVPTSGVTVTVLDPFGDTAATFSAARIGTTAEYQATPFVPRVGAHTLRWDATANTVVLTHTVDVESVGGFYFTVAEVRAMDPKLADETKYPTARILALRDWYEQVWEDFTGAPFVARGFFEKHQHPGGREPVLLGSQFAYELHGAVMNDFIILYQEDVKLTKGGVVYLPPHRGGELAVWYEAGHTRTVPPDVKEAALQTIRARLVEGLGPLSGREASIDTGTGRINLAMPGVRRPFGLPEVDGLALRYQERFATVNVR